MLQGEQTHRPLRKSASHHRGISRPVVQRSRKTRSEFAARYNALPRISPEDSTVLATLVDEVMPYVVEVPSVLTHNAMRGELR